MSTRATASRPGYRGRGRGRSRGRGRGIHSGEAVSNDKSAGTSASAPVPHPPVPEKVRKPPLTHFLALPIGHHVELRHTMSAFTDSLLEATPAIPGLDRSIVIPARRLHFTLGVMSLDLDTKPSSSSTAEASSITPNESGSTRPRTLASAISLLNEIKPQIMDILGEERLRVELRSVDIMKPKRRDLEQAHVMWVGPSQEGDNVRRLKTVAGFIHKAFKTAGLVVDEGRPLKLHCTVLNTIYRKPRTKGRQPFSFSSILSSEAFQAVSGEVNVSADATEGSVSRKPTKGPFSVNLGEWDIDEVQICEMGSWGPEGEYVCVGRCALI